MIYIDSDGVLANFQKFVIEQTGTTYQGIETWKVLENIDNLFTKLEPMEGARSAVQNILDKHGYEDVQILTALPLITAKLVTAQRDKVDWLHYVIDGSIQVNCVANWKLKKYFCRDECDILIDDRIECIEQWKEQGGIGILHVNWGDTNTELRKIGVID